jgi:hypothetical protein
MLGNCRVASQLVASRVVLSSVELVRNWTYKEARPIILATRSQVWHAFASSNTRAVGSYPTRGMNVFLFCCYCPLYLAALWQGWSRLQEALPTVCKVQNFIIDSGWEQTRDKRRIKKKFWEELIDQFPSMRHSQRRKLKKIEDTGNKTISRAFWEKLRGIKLQWAKLSHKHKQSGGTHRQDRHKWINRRTNREQGYLLNILLFQCK